MKFFLVWVVFINLFSVFSIAMESEVGLKYRARARNDQNRGHRGQHGLSMSFKLYKDGSLTFVGVVSSGTSYNGKYTTFVDSTKEDRFDGADEVVNTLALKNLYFEKTTKQELVIRGGALPNQKGLANITARDSGGWIDGVGVTWPVHFGSISMTAGSLNDYNELNMLEREFDPNFLNIHVDMPKIFSERFEAEAGVTVHEGQTYINGAQTYRVTEDGVANVAWAVAEFLASENGVKGAAGVKGKIANFIGDTPLQYNVLLSRNTFGSGDDGDLAGDEITSGFKTIEANKSGGVTYVIVDAKMKFKKRKSSNQFGCRVRDSIDSDVEKRRAECLYQFEKKF